MFALTAIIKKAAKAITMVMVAATVTYGAVEVAHPSVAEAGARKKVQFIAKGLNKFGSTLEKAGRAAQKKRGIMKPIGGILKNTGKGAKKAGNGVNKGIRTVSKGTNKALNKSNVGRAAQNGWRKAQNFQNQGINKVFGKCGGRLCQGAREGVRLFAPM